MNVAILLEYSTPSITPGENVCCDLKIAAILKILKYLPQFHFGLRYE